MGRCEPCDGIFIRGARCGVLAVVVFHAAHAQIASPTFDPGNLWVSVRALEITAICEVSGVELLAFLAFVAAEGVRVDRCNLHEARLTSEEAF